MEDLRRQLAALDADQIKQLLSASGHDALLTGGGKQVEEPGGVAVDVAALKAQGNALFQQRKFEEAVRTYSQCIEASRHGDVDAALFSNRAMAFLKLQQYDRVVDDCTSALAIAPSIKPRLRRAAAYIALSDAASAVQDLEAALGFESGNREAIRLLEQIAVSSEHDRRTRIRAALLVAFRDGWATMAVKGNPAPPGLNGHVLFTIPDDAHHRVFLFGGRAVRDQKSSVFVMDQQDYSWDLASTAGAPPTPRAWHSVCPLSSTMLAVYGGVSAREEDPHVHLLEATPSANGYTLAWRDDINQSSLVPLTRSGHASIAVADTDGTRRVIIFGGRTKRGVTNEVWSLAVKDSVVAMEQIERGQDDPLWPAPRDGHTMVAWTGHIDQKMYGVVFGGNGQQTEDKMNDVWLLDIASRQWKELVCTGDAPRPRSYHSAHIVDNFMIVVGGRMADTEDGNVFVLDLETRHWFRVPIPTAKSLIPRAWHASILRDDRLHDEIYLLGGGTFHGPSREAAVLNLTKFRAIIQKLHS